MEDTQAIGETIPQENWTKRDQTHRYKVLQDERVMNWWRIASLLPVLILASVLALISHKGPGQSSIWLRRGIAILALDILLGCWL